MRRYEQLINYLYTKIVCNNDVALESTNLNSIVELARQSNIPSDCRICSYAVTILFVNLTAIMHTIIRTEKYYDYLKICGSITLPYFDSTSFAKL
jgi:hypothetical protein